MCVHEMPVDTLGKQMETNGPVLDTSKHIVLGDLLVSLFMVAMILIQFGSKSVH